MINISIIVPVYNVDKFLRRCLDSILNQTFKNFELLLIDDGSTDGSSRICDEYSKIDSRIRVFHKQNGGLSSARNFGLAYALGEYVAFIDSDDFVTSDYCEYLYNLIRKNDADVVSANYDFFYDNQKFEKIIDEEKDETLIENTVELLKNYLLQDKINKKNDYPVWIKLYKRKLFETITFPNGKFYEDNITNFYILEKCKKYVKSTKVIYFYFQRMNSITKTQLSLKHLALIDVANLQIELCMKYHDEELSYLAKRKLGMSYFSLLAMYVRYGTNLDFSIINKLVQEYKISKSEFLKSEKGLMIHILSFFMCLNIILLRKIYQLYSKIFRFSKTRR